MLEALDSAGHLHEEPAPPVHFSYSRKEHGLPQRLVIRLIEWLTGQRVQHSVGFTLPSSVVRSSAPPTSSRPSTRRLSSPARRLDIHLRNRVDEKETPVTGRAGRSERNYEALGSERHNDRTRVPGNDKGG